MGRGSLKIPQIKVQNFSTEMKIPPLVERKFLRSTDQPITAPLYEIVIANSGVFKRAKRREMSAAIELSAFTTLIPELAQAKAFVALTQKIPARIFSEILAHAKDSTNPQNFTENLYAVYRDDREEKYYWDEVSRHREFARTIADEENPAYQKAILEIHTHPNGCRQFSSADDADESGKFRLFGILVDIFSPTPSIRLRVGIYDSFWEIPAEMAADAPLESIVDLVRQEEAQLARTFPDFAEGNVNFIYLEDYQVPVTQTFLENL